jgi:tetratricopeptide (TPR) repeat protein
MKLPLLFARPWVGPLVFLAFTIGLTPAHAQTQTSETTELAVNSELTGELLYEILLGELNLQQGQPGAGFSLLLDAARRSNDLQLFARAVDIALQARSGDGALMAARAWAQAYPKDRKANLQVLQILLAVNQTAESLEFLKKEIALAPVSERALAISLVPRHYARVSDKKLAADIVQKALEPYLNQKATAAASWTALGRVRLANEDAQSALQAAQKGRTIDDQAIGPALLALELMGRQINGAEELVTLTLQQQNTPELAMSYVRVLIELRRYSDADLQLQTITRSHPQQAEAWLILGSLQFEQGQDAQAESSLATYVNMASQDKDKDKNSARGITQAQTRRAAIMARQGKLDEARQLLAQLPVTNDEELRRRLMAEVQLLREQRQWQAAFDVLTQANSNHPDLMYEQAMLAEKLNRLDEMEKLLRAVIEQDPEYHNAYNALGFSLADRKLRLPEAKALIIKALGFAPNDPFITDSLGWVEFRLGNLPSALNHLQKAYQDRADPEIAAHLGEVLWQLNRLDEARAIWREGFKVAPDNETLLETLQRLKVKL